MTATFDTMLPINRPLRWNVFFAEDSDRDLDFDEGFEEDELLQSKPPSRRPLLWILLLLLVGVAAYWILNNPSPNMSQTATIGSIEAVNSAPDVNVTPPTTVPLFGEDQTVVFVEEARESMLMGDLANTRPGPMVQAGEHLTVLDGVQQPHGWVYWVKAKSGETGWISEEMIKSPS